MNMRASRLKAMGARPVWFNVWHHQHEEVLLAPLLQAITQQAIPNLGQWEGWTFRCRLLWQRWRQPDWAVLSGTAALLSVPAYLVWLAYRSDGTSGFWLQRMLDRCVRDLHVLAHTLTGGQWIATVKGDGLGDLVAAAYMALREDTVDGWLIPMVAGLILCWVMLIRFLMRPFPARPAILLASMDGRFSLSRAEAQTDFRQRFRRHFGDVACALEPRTMTIFIDDLDRCKPEKAAELLESVNYLSDAGHCFVVLGVARDIVEAQVASAQKTLAEEQGAMERAGKNEPVTVSAHKRRRRTRIGWTMHVNTSASSSSLMSIYQR